MPTYEFRLPDGTIIERSFKISEVPAEIPNPNGEGTAVRIISGGAALLFKGSGFYLTDYGRNAHRTQGDAPKPAGEAAASSESKPKTESAGTSGGSSSGSGGGDAKPAPAPAPKSDSKPSGSGPSAP
jgi:predicted nucleic acid-binding Zn ribbon protein